MYICSWSPQLYNSCDITLRQVVHQTLSCPHVELASTNYNQTQPNLSLSSHYCSMAIWKTLDKYAFNNTQELDNMDNVTMIYLPRVHNLTKDLLVHGLQVITMVNMHNPEGQVV